MGSIHYSNSRNSQPGRAPIYLINIPPLRNLLRIEKSRQTFLELIKRWEVWVLVLSGLFLSIDKLNLPGSVSVSPAFTIASLAVLVFTLKIRPTSRLTTAFFWFIAYTAVHGLLLALTDVTFGDYGASRFLSYVRQMVAILGGIAVFSLARQLVIASRPSKLTLLFLLGGIPAALLAVMQQTGANPDGGLFTPLNHFVRNHIIATDLYMPRVTGLSPEPAAFSGYLAAIALPLAVGLIFANRRSLRITGMLGFIVSVALILLTFSGIGYFLLTIVAVTSVLVTPRKWILHAVVVLGVVIAAEYSTLVFTPGNYLIEVVRETESFTYNQRQLDQATATPTEQPTVAPTEQPTVAPTEQPTVAPTEQPTVAPTEQPTAAPTEQPTVAPTEQPTVAPTEQPTAAPTEQPTVAPTEQPTVAPTEQPTAAPTVKPTPVSPKWVRDIGKPLGVSDPLLIFSAILGKKTGTFASKTYSTVDPIKNMASARGFIGYGLGGSPYHATEFLSPQALEHFPNTAAGRQATLKTLMGRIASETGVIGILLLGWIIIVAFVELRKILRKQTEDSILARTAIIMLTAIVLGSVATFGSLATPHLWLALGITAGLITKSSSTEPTAQS